MDALGKFGEARVALDLTHLSCSPNFPRASITRYTHAKHEQILKLRILKKNMARHGEIYDINCKIEKIEKEKILYRSSDSFKIGSWLGASI